MKVYVAIIASVMLLATNAALGRDRAAMLTGVDKTVAHGTPATNGSQTMWAARDGMDQTRAIPNAAVVLTAGRGGGLMPGRMQAQSGWSSRSHWDQGFHSRFFGDHSFRGGFHHDRFHHRDHFMHKGFRPYPYGRYYFYPYGYYPYRYYYPYSYYYPYGYYYGYPWYIYPYPYFYFYFSW